MNLNQLLTALDNAQISAKDPLDRRVLANEANDLRAHAQRAQQKQSLEHRLAGLKGDGSDQAASACASLERDLDRYSDVDLGARIKQSEYLLRQHTT